jgi:hypothetical protein
MNPSDSPEATVGASVAPSAAPARLPPLRRAFAIFVRPATAWEGLSERAQWWMPLLLVLVVTLAGSALIYRRAQVPTILDAMEEKVSSGQMTPEQLQRIEGFYTGPAGLLFTLGAGTVWLTLLPFLVALLVWFAVGFVLGSPFRYRLALEVTTWASLVTLPATALSLALAWIRQNVRGVHIGFGVLVPDAGPDDKLLRSIGVFLDWIGPFGIWHVAVAILGAAALSGAPRKSVAWALGTLYVVSGLLAAALAALMPGGT